MSDFDLPIGAIPSSWSVAELKEVTSKIGSGATPRGGAKVYRDEGTAFIRSQNVLDNEFSVRGLVHIDDDAADALSGVSVLPGDVLFNITGDSILRTCVVPDSVLPARVSQHVAIIRSNGSVDPLFLQKYLTIPAVKEYMLGHSAGGTRKAITKGHIEGFVVPFPPLPEQRAIAEVLGALDDKIESNRRVARLLDESFHLEWRRSFGGQGSLTWETIRLGDFCSTQYGFTASATSEDVGPRFLRVMDINKQNWIDWSGVPHAAVTPKDEEKYGLSKGDLVIARMADPGKSAIVEEDAPGAVFASYLVRLKPETLADSYFLFGFLKSPGFMDFAGGAASGSVQKNMNARVMGEAEFTLPTKAERDVFLKTVLPGRRMLQHSVGENRALVMLRDALLPALLSGRIRVPAAAELVEA